MSISKRARAAVFTLVGASLSLALAAGAFGEDHGGRHGRRHGAPLTNESLAPSQPADPAFHGVAPGNLPWVLTRGDVRLKSGGKFDLRVRGLVIPSQGTPGPVTSISASLYCGADSNSTAAGTTQTVPLSRSGDARIRDNSFTVPSSCLAPIVLVHPNGLMNLYISVDGWRG